ncbi:YdeI/OmpD-associated family protein [Cognatiyoonia sp. IB215446]|uniref:YdeI/OmpD-associated family protein n=1 Tax=Cognatiyoonia sp. IB215446 TaxID=3097355 RepID=UPI002A170A46|nr:YdeI/OmpD-associated family protein [Cognatiyoonia sp. IB215446]MDX8350323.1 YdeI/OmpD-associated family protein [Cognatiyoonia sp. IB215446]
MSDYHTFEGEVVPMPWGKSTYTVLPLPDEIAAALQSERAKRVEGEINDHPVNLALTKAPVLDQVFLWAGRSLLDEIGITPGERLEVRLRKADDSVDTPEDVMRALREADITATWEALTPGKKRGLLHQIKTAKRAETRAKRIAKLISDLT